MVEKGFINKIKNAYKRMKFEESKEGFLETQPCKKIIEELTEKVSEKFLNEFIETCSEAYAFGKTGYYPKRE